MDSEAKTLVDGGSAGLPDPVVGAGVGRVIPVKVGRFYIFRQIAEGGMGQVLLGYDETLSRKLAIKLWRPRASSGEDLRARMLREAQALARLSHPNVVQVYEVGDHRDQLYLAMEYVDGRTLREWVKQSRPELAQILERYTQAGRGLAAAHRAGVLHRDFKPDNAVIGDDGRVRVLDFGLARSDANVSEGPGQGPASATSNHSQESFDASITRAGSIMGTPAYMPPEQLVGLDTDARSDLYSFCVALWEAIHEMRPFIGATTRELSAAIHAHRPRESRRPVPGWLRAALLRGLAADPAARWPGMDALLDALAAGARRRRRRVALGLGLGLAALLAAGVGVALAGRARELAACEARGAAIDEVWSERARADLRAALLAPGQPFAAHSAQRVDELLDRYAHTWSEGQVEACRRTRVDRTWSPEVDARADACFDELRLELEGLVGVLVEADPTTARRAVEAAASLPAVDLCLDVDALARRPQLPREAAARDEAAALQRELARARSLDAAGRYADGLALAERLQARADALGWPPLMARVRLVAAAEAATLGDRDSAKLERLLEDALYLALDAGHDALAVDAALELLDFCGLMLMRPADGQRWARLARSLLLRLGAERPALAAKLECSAAELDKIRGNFTAAGAAFERCHAARIAAFGPDHPAVALALTDRASLERLQGASGRARELLEQARAALEPAYGPDHPTIARTLAQLGEVQVTLGDYPAAEASLQRALAIDIQAFGADHERVGSDHYALGQLYGSLARPTDAVRHLERSLALFEGVPGMGRAMQIAALGDLTAAHRRLGDLDRALASAQRALALYEAAFGPEHTSLAPSLVDVAAIHAARGEPEPADRLIERARKLMDGDTIDLLPTLLVLGDLNHQRGDPDSAQQDYTRARALAEKLLGPDHRNVGLPLARLGALARERGRVDEAIALLTRAEQLLAAPGARAELGAARFSLARALWDRGQAPRARELARLAADDLALQDPQAQAAALAWLAEHPA